MTATETVTTNPLGASRRIGPADLIDADKPADLAGLVAVAKALVAHEKGLLAMDESIHTCNERFAAIGIPPSELARRDYRDLLVSTPGLAESISGAILYDETIRQHTTGGVPFAQAVAEAEMIPGIKVDIGEAPLPGHRGEYVTEGLDGLPDRLTEYRLMGALFAKWRSVLTVGADIPSTGCIDANASVLARYAAACQEAGLVPVVEPEVLMVGSHSLARCEEVTETVLRAVFAQLVDQRVALEAMILKPNMVLPGSTCPVESGVEEVAEATLRCLLRTVPAAVPGVAFLSGGQTGALASARLNAMNRKEPSPPWALTFSFARAIQHPALEIWGGDPANITAAQAALSHRARCSQAARRGDYRPAMEATERE